MQELSRRTFAGGAAALLACASAPASEPSPASLRRGVNAWPWFSLTREFPAPRTDYAWPPLQPQRPSPRPQDLRRLRSAGFDFVRIPVDPGPFLSFAGDQRAILLEQLFDAVRQCHGAGLSAVVNLQSNEATHHWNSSFMLASLASPGFGAYKALAGDVAAGLARMDLARVALEPVNEPPQACGAADWSAVQNALLGAARAAAPGLTLVASGACGSMIRGLEALDPAAIAAGGPLLYTFHFYEPYLFTHQGAPWMREPVYRALNNVPWPGAAGDLGTTLDAVRARMAADADVPRAAQEAAYAETERALKVYFDANPDRRFVEHYFGMAKDWAARHGISPAKILLGEFGALRTDARYTASKAPDRARYVRDVREAAEAAGFPWAFWNLFDGMGLMDDGSRALDPAMISALGLAMPAL